MRQIVRLGALALAGCLAASSLMAGAESVWSRAQVPALGPALAIGGYSSGCVQGAQELPARTDGTRYRIMKPERKRTFGHPLLIDYITRLGERLEAKGQAPLGVGDLGQARGGPAPNGHASHQNGLDVDLWFAPGTAGSEQYSVVDLEKQKASELWSDRVPVLLEAAASDSHVARIFVNAVIKQRLCEQTTGDRAWLGKLRPWWGHNEHFHVRLACPADSPECQAQPPLPPGDGCNEVDWWLNPESSKDRNVGVESYKKRVGAQPKLPDTCQKVAR
jgi:penicillin-insensitive murein endopeptidase